MYFSCTFINQLKKRFGRQYGKAICKLTTILVIFSVAFLYRGTFNIAIYFIHPNETLNMSAIGFALFLASFYIVCEVLPLLLIYYQHRKDFIKYEAELCREFPLSRKSTAPALKNTALYGSIEVIRPDSNDGVSESENSTFRGTPVIVDENLRKSDILRNDLDDESDFDIKWEPGLLNQDLMITMMKNKLLRGTGTEADSELDEKKFNRFSKAIEP